MNRQNSIQKQAGVVLVIGLVFLMMMTIVGVTAIQSSTMQEKMAGNVSDRNLVFQNAEAALQAGELQVIDKDCTFLDSNTAGQPDPDNTDWNDANVVKLDTVFPHRAYALTRVPPQQSEDESEEAEAEGTCGGFYFVTAKAESPKGMTVVLQSTVFKRF
ncbi:pilus assembly PilX family protein [Thiocystis violacea]|uniref:pilus assembly PilX family protein n=1 Tax=Thiocystis violacea TaxID=13725 RepID=UPI001902FFAE|nr:PilX N-terminal domain-containing pilus assembly protein [Thiocystis violacea]MBK1719526.1 hypothetical protein [Thiocystis violacea]